MSKILEICAGSVQSVVAARDGGATRVELCSALEIGGITPSTGLISEARNVEGIALHVLIRPRGGDFMYSEDEVACMEHDIAVARQHGADGVVIGALTANGDIDMPTCQRLMRAAQGIHVTFHRAFDVCRNPLQALEDIISLGCDRLLTSGQAATAEKGTAMLQELVKASAGRIVIMPGCGVNASNAAHILTASGATEIHASARTEIGSNMIYRHSGVSMGTPGNDEYSRKETDAHQVAAIVKAIAHI